MWLYNDKEYVYNEADYGFIYKIVNNTNGKWYIGRKFLTAAGYKTVKGKRKKVRKESDWKDYWGSSPELQKDIELLGKENFTRTILHLCPSRGVCNYMETKEIFSTDAVLDENSYNSWVSCKIHRAHVKPLWKEQNDQKT